MRIWILAGVVLVAFMVAIVSCFVPPGDARRDVVRLAVINAEINYLSSFSIDDPFAAVIAGAIAEYEAVSGNRVNVIWSGSETTEEAYARLAGGVRVDIWDGDLEQQLRRNAEFMLDLTPFYGRSNALFGNRSMNSIINPFLLDLAQQMSYRFAPEGSRGALLAVPFAPFNVAFVYNEAYFAQTGIGVRPRTWGEFLNTSERLKIRGFMPLSSQMEPHIAYGYYLARMMGTDWVEELMDNPSMWSDPAVFRMATLFEQLASGGHLSIHEQRANPGPHANINDRVAMWLMRTSDISELVAKNPPGATFGAFNFPRIEGERGGFDDLPAGQIATMHGSHAFFIANDTRYADYAFELIATIFSPNFDQQLANETLSIPFAADIPWPVEIRGIARSFNEIGGWIPYGGGALADTDTKKRANAEFRQILQHRGLAREFINSMMIQE